MGLGHTRRIFEGGEVYRLQGVRCRVCSGRNSKGGTEREGLGKGCTQRGGKEMNSKGGMGLQRTRKVSIRRWGRIGIRGTRRYAEGSGVTERIGSRKGIQTHRVRTFAVWKCSREQCSREKCS
jgi:hypothetical protein